MLTGSTRSSKLGDGPPDAQRRERLEMWVGVRLARRISPVLFYRLLTLGMFLTGVKLLWDAFLSPN